MTHNHVHHVHIFASDIERSIAFYRDCLGGEVVLDLPLAGARNVFMRVGRGRIHLYDQAPRNSERGGGIHHFGVQTDDLEQLVARMREQGVAFNKAITDLGPWKYVMVMAPDEVLIELFEVDRGALPAQVADFFE
jgi:catechol 2,3-dioxygenase-like lactoylglutathione lyase family enzyme